MVTPLILTFTGEPSVPESPSPAQELLVDVLREPATIVATGALTNFAWLLTEAPDAAANITEIVWMGGSTDRGNLDTNAFWDKLLTAISVC
ncbi:nucleoside hydrolase [Kribbella sp. NPDC059898]|uniref:nucleoside hydrolase n=1 Tax=Kribbella sp. NPDC059898 TaxID=3346995 RepID=UPI003659B20A